MGYLGLTPTTAQQNYLNIDDISGSFNGSTTSFALQVGSVAPTPFPVTNSCLISVGGVIQEPDDTGTSGFRISGGNIVFSSAPGTGEDFFGLVLAGADYLNIGANFPDGTVGTPSITFDSDTNTGIYHPSADELSIVTGGSDRVRVDSNGRLGIGTSSPGSFDSEANQLVVGNGAGDQGITIYTGSAVGDHGSIYFADGTTGGAVRKGQIRYEQNNEAMSFWTNENERCRIDLSGRLLVGTSSARANFLNGSVTALGQIEGSGSGTGRGTFSVINNASTEFPATLLLGRSNANTIGSNTLVANNDWCGRIGFQGNDGSEFVELASISGFVDGTPAANDMPGRLVFSTTASGDNAPTERLRISANGKIEASGQVQLTDGSAGSPGLTFSNEGGADTGIFRPGANILAFSTDGTERFRIPQDGEASFKGDGSVLNCRTGAAAGGTDVFIVRNNCGANTSAGNISLVIEADGDVQNTNNSYGALSDIKLKENIVDASSQWDDLKAIQVRNYNFKEETGHLTHTQIGVIAQEIELVSPGLVSDSPDVDEDGNDLGTVTKSVNYSVLYMKAVKALQEAQTRIETLEAEVAALKNA